MEVKEEEDYQYTYQSLHCHHKNDSCTLKI